MQFSPEQMILALRVLSGVGFAFWLLVIFDGKRWWPAQWSLHLDSAARQMRPGAVGELVVVITARNEAALIPRTLPRLLKQQEWYRKLVVVDDRSEDRTRTAAERIAHGTPAEDKLEAIRVDETPEDWAGRVHAAQVGVELATKGWRGEAAQQWILFTAADIQHTTSSISRMMSKADSGPFDLVSVMVRPRVSSLWDKLLIPPFIYLFQFCYPFRKVSDPRSNVAAASSNCLLVRRSTLEELGGLEAVRTQLLDGISLAHLAKKVGAQCWLGMDPDLMSLRVYGEMGVIVRRLARTAFESIGRRYTLVPLVLLGTLVVGVAPAVLTIVGAALLDPFIAVPALLAWLFQAAQMLQVVQYLGASSSFALTLPIAALVYMYVLTLSAWRQLTGTAARWRETSEFDAGSA